MSVDDAVKRAFLQELYDRSQGDFDAQVSMYDIGDTLGIEHDTAAEIAHEMYIEGLAEMKTLSGGMGIAQKGLESLDIKVPATVDEDSYQLGSAPVLEASGREAVVRIASEIRSEIDLSDTVFDAVETVVIDLKTIEVQMLSPNPKKSIVREALRSIRDALGNAGGAPLQQKLDTMIS